MIPGTIAYVIAAWWVARLPVLPDLDAMFILLPILLFGAIHNRCGTLSMLILGGLSTYLCAAGLIGARLPDHLEGRDLAVTGFVVDLPRTQDGIARFRFRLLADPDTVAGALKTPDQTSARGDIYLSWYHPKQAVIPGQIWHLTVRLDQPAGSVNFSLFDYEGWLFSERISAKGYIRTSQPVRLLGQVLPSIHNLRYHIRERLQHHAGDHALFGLLNALAIGDTSYMTSEQWTLLGRTGTTHLLVISGLHVGLVATFIFWIQRRLGAGHRICVAVTIVVTACYALLAGWGLPVQRALVMTTVILLAVCGGRQVALNDQFFLALLFVLLLDPLATLSNGFWLSFGAVMLLVVGLAGRVDSSGIEITDNGIRARLVRSARAVAGVFGLALRVQWVLFAGMIALLVTLLHQVPLVSFPVNLIAIPWVGVVVVPAIMISVLLLSIFEPLGHLLLKIPLFALDLLTWLLGAFSELDAVYYFGSIGLFATLLAGLGSLMLLLPRGLVPGWLGLLSLFALTLDREPIEEGELLLTFLDVGQGLSVIAETRLSLMLYDTGPAFGTRFSNARQVVLPTLRFSGKRRINQFVVSHSDNDHAGGIGDILTGIAVGRRFLPEKSHAGKEKRRSKASCDGRWQADSVDFRVFMAGDKADSGNDLSCLVLIGAAGHWVLLTGDIEASAEHALLDLELPPITVMSAPHHGSDTSSSPAFLNHVRPEMVVISAGYRNRFSHPADEVVARYRNRSIRQFNTADHGAVRIRITHAGVDVELARTARPAIWRRRDPG